MCEGQLNTECVLEKGRNEPDLKQQDGILYKRVTEDPFFLGISDDAMKRVHTQLEVIEVGIKQTSLSWLLSGSSLTLIKVDQPHGDFGKWFSEKFDQTPRSAQNRMRAATMFQGKFEAASSLAVTSIILLSKEKNASVAKQVIEGLESGTKYRLTDIKAMIANLSIKTSGDQRQEKKLKLAHKAALALLEGEGAKDIGALIEVIKKVDGKLFVGCLLTELDAMRQR